MMLRLSAVACTAAMLLAACSRFPIGAGYEADLVSFDRVLPETAAALASGTATDADVLAALGPPAAITALPEGYAFLYEGGQLRNRGIGANFYQARASYAWSAAGFSLAAFVFDREGRLTAAAVARTDEGTGKGFSIGTQSAAAVDQLPFILPATQHAWGRQLLARLPAGLNAGSDLDSGAAGFELRGTSPSVGQRALASGYNDAQALLDVLKRQAGQ
jgi:hypothetical protein